MSEAAENERPEAGENVEIDDKKEDVEKTKEEGDQKDVSDVKVESDQIVEGEIKEEVDEKNEDDIKEEGDRKEEGSKNEKVDAEEEGVTEEEDEAKEEEEAPRKSRFSDPGRKSKADKLKEALKKKEDANEEEFFKKKKKKEKIRRVDMDEFYPDESVSSTDDLKMKGKEGEQRKVAGKAIVDEIEHSDERVDLTKDYDLVDPSFLDEFDTSEEEVAAAARRAEAERMAAEALEEEEEEEEEMQQEIFVQPPEREPSDRVYDQICDLETPISSDESFTVPRFKYIQRRKCLALRGATVEDDKWLGGKSSDLSLDVPSNSVKYLMDNIVPELKQTLIEVASYQPENAVRYMTYSLLHKTKDFEELGLDPDPHLIQALVDGQKKKKKPSLKKPEIFVEPFAESEIAVPKIDAPVQSSSTDEDYSHIHIIQKKFKKAKKKLVTEEKEKRSTLDRKTMDPGPCLGPTSLPLPLQPVVSTPVRGQT